MIPAFFIKLLFLQYKPELWQIGITGILLLTDKTPQLLEKVFKPSSGTDLVPSGKMIKDVPFEIFFEPLFITVL